MAKTGINLTEVNLNTVDVDVAKGLLSNNLEGEKLRAQTHQTLIATLGSPGVLGFIIILLIVIGGIGLMLMTGRFQDAMEFWKLVFPGITAFLGYLFGRSSKS